MLQPVARVAVPRPCVTSGPDVDDTRAETAGRRDDYVTVLTHRSGNVRPRGQTLEAAMEHGYDMLSEPERALLERLSVFDGGCTLKLLLEVCGGDGVDPEECPSLLVGLVTKSLVGAQNGPHGTRYGLPEAMQQCGRSRLAASGELTGTADRHLGAFLSLAERAETELIGPDQQEWLDYLESEHDNLRGAIRWSLSRERTGDAVRLVVALTLFWRIRGQVAESRAWLDQVLIASEGTPSPARTRAVWSKEIMAGMAGDYDTAAAAGAASLAAFRESGDRRGQARSLLLLGTCAVATEGATAGVAHLEGAVALARAEGDTWCLGHALAIGGLSASDHGDQAAARCGFQQCITVALAARDDHCLAVGLNGLGRAALAQGDYAAAELHLEVALARASGIHGRLEMAQALSDLALVAIGRGDHERARPLLDEAESLAHATGSATSLASATEVQARLVWAEGDLDDAERLYGESLRVAEEAGGTSPPALQGLAEVALARADPIKARELLDEAHARAEARGHRARIADALWGLGKVAQLEGDDAEAGTLHCDALELRSQIGDLPGIAASLEALAGLAARASRVDQATRGLAAAQALRQQHGYSRSASAEADYAASLASARQALGDALFAAAWADGTSMPADKAVGQLSRGHRRLERAVTGWGSLTGAESEVATLAGNGLTNAEIGEELFVSANTVKTHLTRVFAKLHISSRRDLTRRFMQDG